MVEKMKKQLFKFADDYNPDEHQEKEKDWSSPFTEIITEEDFANFIHWYEKHIMKKGIEL